MRTIRAVLFDFGGVLAEEGFSEGLEALAAEQRLPVADMVAEGVRAVYDSGFVVGRGSEADFWALLRERTGLRGDDGALTARILAGFIVRPWMLRLAERLLSLCYITGILSGQTDWIERLDQEQHFFRCFDRVYNSYHLGKGKRDPTVFSEVAADLRLSPSHILFIDDNAGNVARAGSAGMRAIHYRGRGRFLQELDRCLLTG
jgi:putative hydrolase of the HAD superfamily